MNDPRPALADLCRLMYERNLMDSAGGNLSVRGEECFYITPRFSGSRRRWQLRPEEIVRVGMDGVKLDGEGEASREYRVHLAIYGSIAEATAVIHAHPPNIMVFASAEKPIEPASEQTDKYGTIELAQKLKAHSAELAAAVATTLAPKAELIHEHAIACLLARHGIVVAARDLDEAYDCLERIEGSARIWIARMAMGW